MKYIVSKYNHKISWLEDYASFANEVVIYDRSELTDETGGKNRYQDGHRFFNVKNIGSDIYDKLTYIIDNYDNLPDVACYIKANLFDYIKPREFEKIKDNTIFTPILSLEHQTTPGISFYSQGLYAEINNYWYLNAHPAKYADEIIKIFKMNEREYNYFAPGSNYIIPKENILQHPKELYVKLRSFLDWAVYPGDAQLLERNLYYLWNLRD